jgi:hypothetical protein
MDAATTSESFEKRLAAENKASTRPRSTSSARFSEDRSQMFLVVGSDPAGAGSPGTKTHRGTHARISTRPSSTHEPHPDTRRA